MKLTEITARALIVKNEQIVLTKHKKLNVSFMPGGHVEFGETIETALTREIKEEMGVDAKLGKLWAIMENFFKQDNNDVHEISFIYKAEIPDKPIASQESHLEIFWAPLFDLEKLNHLPTQLITPLINDHSKQGPFHFIYKD